MDGFWSKVVQATGAVGVVAFLLFHFINLIYAEQIIAMFGSDRMFAITIIILAVLGLSLLILSIKSAHKRDASKDSGSSPAVNYRDKATHKGDNNFN